jgi:hypothetical protein
MTNISRQVLLAAALLVTVMINAQDKDSYKPVYRQKTQKIAIYSGDISVLGNVNSFKVGYNDDKFTLGIKGEPDSVYFRKKISELNAKKAGRGDEWKAEWDKTSATFFPAFLEGYIEGSAKAAVPPLLVNPDKPADHIMTVRPIFLDFNGWNGHTVGLLLDIAAAGEPEKVLLTLLVNAQYYWKSKAYPGYDPGTFFTAGKSLGIWFRKDVYRKR